MTTNINLHNLPQETVSLSREFSGHLSSYISLSLFFLFLTLNLHSPPPSKCELLGLSTLITDKMYEKKVGSEVHNKSNVYEI